MFANLVSTYFARFSGLGAYLILLPLVLNQVGSEAYGLYAMTAAFAVLFQQDLGLGGSATRSVAIAKARGDARAVREYASTFVLACLALGCVGAVGATLGFNLFWRSVDVRSELEALAGDLTLLAVAGIAIALSSAGVRHVLIGLGSLSAVNLVVIGQAVVRLAGTALVLSAGCGVLSVALVDVGAAVVAWTALVCVRRVRHSGVGVSFRYIRRARLRELARSSLALLVIALSGSVVVQGGAVVAGSVLGPQAVAAYAVAQRVYVTLKEVTGSLAVVALPAAAQAEGAGASGKLTRGYVDGTAVGSALLFYAAVPAVGFMDLWLFLWVGDLASAARLPALILILSLVANANHLLATPILTARGRLGAYSVLHAVWACSGVLLAYFLGSAFGTVWAVATGMVLPLIVLEPFYVWAALRELEVSAVRFIGDVVLRPIVVAAFGMVAVSVVRMAFGCGVATAVVFVAGWLVTAPWLFYRFFRPELRVTIFKVLSALPARSKRK